MTFLSKTECSALRGIAILGIMLHNFLHWLKTMTQENEYTFIQKNVDDICNVIVNPQADMPLQLISFFGHYGVPVFLFLSGYGLVKKYEAVDDGGNLRHPAEPTGSFIWKHFKKLFPMMILGFAVFAMIDWMTPGRHHWTWVELLAQLTMTINLLPDPDRIIWPGPYWFFSLMMQLYIVYRVLLYRRHWGYTVALIAICWAIQAVCCGDPEGELLNRIRYNCIGGVLPFGIGLLLARLEHRITTPSLSTSISLCILGLLGIVTFSLNFHTWLWVPAFIILLHVAFVKTLPQLLVKALDWVGILSSALFVCHPIARKIFIPISRGGDIMDGLLIYVIASIVLAMLAEKILGNGLNIKK